MKRFTIAEIANISGGKVLCGDESYLVSGYAIDSRETTPGEVFFAIKGAATDGHKFIPQVLEKGCNSLVISDEKQLPEGAEQKANIVVVEDALKALQALGKHYLNSLPLKKKIGITGSVGKTSTRDMTYYVINEKYKAAKNKKNYNSSTGIPLSILEFPEDTEVAILEMGMEVPGEIKELAELVEPDIAVITSVTEVNMVVFETVERILDAKMEITSKLGKDSTLIVNSTWPMLSPERVSGDYNLTTVGSDALANYVVGEVCDYGDKGIKFSLDCNDEKHVVSLPVAGGHNAYNASLAIAVGMMLGISVEEAERGLQNTELTGKRLNIFEHNGMKIIEDCYNACRDSVKSAINTLAATEGNRKVAIIGDILGLGAISKESHFDIGRYAAEKNIDLIVAIGPEAIEYANGAKTLLDDKRVLYFAKKEDFIDIKDNIIKSGDVILLKASRGMELEKIAEEIIKL